MPLTIQSIQNLKRLSNSNFIKHVCEICSTEYYSIRPSKFCHSRCKQEAYRRRKQNIEIKNKDDPDIQFTSTSSIDEENIQRLKKIENEINYKLKKLKQNGTNE